MRSADRDLHAHEHQGGAITDGTASWQLARARRFFRSAAPPWRCRRAQFRGSPAWRADVASEMNNFFGRGRRGQCHRPLCLSGSIGWLLFARERLTRFPRKACSRSTFSYRARLAVAVSTFSGSFVHQRLRRSSRCWKATANNALGFRFKLAIDSVSPEIGKVMDEFSQKAQLLNQMVNISSCETAQALVGGIWPQMI